MSLTKATYSMIDGAPANVLDFGAAGDGVTNDTAAITAAFASGKPLYFPEGTYLYTPADTIDIAVPLFGAGKRESIIQCVSSAGMVGKPVFRLTDGSISDIQINESAAGKTMHGVEFSNADPDAFTGFLTMERVYIYGFNRGLTVNNIFNLTVTAARVTGCTEGLYGAPVDNVGDNGYFTTLTFIGCYFFSNTRNAYFNPAIKSPAVLFESCVFETATGAAEQSSFSNIEPLTFLNCYWEGADTIPAVRLSSCTTDMLSCNYNACGAVNLGSVSNSIIFENCKVSSGSANAVIYANGTLQQTIVVRDCAFPASGHTLNANTVELTRTPINGYDTSSALFGTAVLIQGVNQTGTEMTNLVRVSVSPANNSVSAHGSLLLAQVNVSGIFADAAGYATPNKHIAGLIYTVEPAASGSPDFYEIYAHNLTASPVAFTSLTVKAVITGFA